MKFIEKVQQWLLAKNKDWELGAKFMLQCNGNKIQYKNVTRRLDNNHDVIEYEINKWFKAQAPEETKQEVREMREKVSNIVAKERLDKPKTTKSFAKGKRTDHEELPDEVKALYVENFAIVQKMRELHLKLVMIAKDDKVTCLDSEQYPFLKELIEKDKQLRENWKQYDNYSLESPEQIISEKEKQDSLKAIRMVNMMKGKYKKNPNEESKEKILSYYKKIVNPSEKLTNELKEIGIL